MSSKHCPNTPPNSGITMQARREVADIMADLLADPASPFTRRIALV
jgi:hypothetical protein